MAEVVLYHHAQGLTPGVVAFADELGGSSASGRRPPPGRSRQARALADGHPGRRRG
jgi:hypothetical protein